MFITRLYKEFFDSEKTGGLILIIMTVVSMILANSQWGDSYMDFWNTKAGGHTIVHWINDGLMAIFFLLIGLELEREIYQGELSSFKNASLPIFAAIGGMIVPAGIFMLLNYGTPAQSGAGIPMATDIAFAIGILSLLGNKVPVSLKIFLTALAVIDDLGAIIIIAIFYTGAMSVINLLIALGIFIFLIVLNRMKVNSLIPYLIGGIIMWIFMSKSGVHATITGVLLAFTIPFKNGSDKSPSYSLQHFLNKPVALFILPLFALANTSLVIDSDIMSKLGNNHSIGIMAGLFIGKPLGILLFSFLGVSLGLSSIPPELSWKNIAGIGFLAGIGFTMSIFISLLAFKSPELINISKISVFAGSLLSGIAGLIILRVSLKNQPEIARNKGS
jgi:NhaA family Na+:H+ antiporter